MEAAMSAWSDVSVCVFCGSRDGLNPAMGVAAEALAEALAVRRCQLVYGGASIGVMGRLADAALARDVLVHGVIPAALFRREVAHAGLTELHEVDGMHARKALMTDLSDLFVALPGGFGTLEELFEVVTWSQLGLHDKPIGLLDVDGFWAGLTKLLDRATQDGFITDERRGSLLIDDDPGRLLDRLHDRVTT